MLIMLLCPLLQVGDLVLGAIAGDDLVELESLLDMAKENDMIRIHATKGLRYLRRRKMEERLKAAVRAGGPPEELQSALEGAVEASVPPSLIEKAQFLLAKLMAIKELAEADAASEWERLDRAIASARAAHVDEPSVAPYLPRMLKLRAASRLKACLGKGEDGYKSLQSMYDDAVSTGLDGADVDEAKRLLDLLANAQRFFRGTFDKWMGGRYDGEAAAEAAAAATVAAGGGLLEVTEAPPSPGAPPSPSPPSGGLQRWLDNPQWRLEVGDATIMKMSVSVDRAGDASYGEYAVHVVRSAPEGRAAPSLQVGPSHSVVASTQYLHDAAHEGSCASLTFEAEAGQTYFVVPSTLQPKQEGGFSITTIGVGSCKGARTAVHLYASPCIPSMPTPSSPHLVTRKCMPAPAHYLSSADTLEPVLLVQADLRAAMASQAFEALPPLVERAESASVGLAAHPLVASAKLISEMERGWQEKNAEAMGIAISAAKAAKVERGLIKVYGQRYKQLAIEDKLRKGMQGDTPLLHAACEEARIIGYSGPVLEEAEGKLKRFKTRLRVGGVFLDDTAVGARKFGSWRENPTWRLAVAKTTTLYIAVNEDGALGADSQARVEKRQAKKQAQYAKAKDKMVATQVATTPPIAAESGTRIPFPYVLAFLSHSHSAHPSVTAAWPL